MKTWLTIIMALMVMMVILAERDRKHLEDLEEQSRLRKIDIGYSEQYGMCVVAITTRDSIPKMFGIFRMNCKDTVILKDLN